MNDKKNQNHQQTSSDQNLVCPNKSDKKLLHNVKSDYSKKINNKSVDELLLNLQPTIKKLADYDKKK